MKIILSKSQWQIIGNKTGWSKSASNTDIYKSIRKSLPPSGKIMDSKTPPRNKKINTEINNLNELNELKEEAEFLCSRYDHKLGKWNGNNNTCQKCQKTVEVNLKNNDIKGTAIQGECI